MDGLSGAFMRPGEEEGNANDDTAVNVFELFPAVTCASFLGTVVEV